eukprot:INCI6535.1.p1 GENE.INCI6535.1~~INCI6535.1.p1  ORF type:complete len:303 (-),score=40.11 INCI6535.1:160-1068(-)
MPRPKDSIGQLLNPCTSYREKLIRKGIKPKDYAKENRRRLRELEARNKKAAVLSEEAAQPKKFATPSKYQNVQPRAFSAAEQQAQKWSKKHSFIHRRSPQVPPVSEHFAPFVETVHRVHEDHVKPPLPRAAVEPEPTPERPRKNFIVNNIRAADRMTPPAKMSPVRRHRNFGKVPQYLLKRNAELALQKLKQESEEQKRAQTRPGMRLLSEQERLHTLRVLQDTQSEVLKALSALPLALGTYGQNQRMTAIQNKLVELERSIKLFSKPEVYVQQEEHVPLPPTAQEGWDEEQYETPREVETW